MVRKRVKAIPTYKNKSKSPVSFHLNLFQLEEGKFRRVIVTFTADEEKRLPFALPYYAEKGLVVIDEENPALPDPIIFANILEYPEGVSREFMIRPCDRYFVQIIAQVGKVSARFGRHGTPFVIDADQPVRAMFEKKIDWESAPLLIIEGADGGGTCTLHVEAVQAGEMGGVR